MPLSTDYSKHSKALVMIEEAVSGELEQRERVKEQKLFVYAHDGQWDPSVVQKRGARYRGTFDLCMPIVENFQGEILGSSFSLRFSPKDSAASKDIASIYDGLTRNIRSISGADALFNKQAVSCLVGGFDCVEVVQEHNNDKTSFDQDLYIKPVANASDSVWFDPASIEQDKSDANWSVKKQNIPTVDYEARWNEETRSNMSIGEETNGRTRNSTVAHDTITVAQLYYRKEFKTIIVKMTNGDVFEENEDFLKIQDELADKGQLVAGRKTVKIIKVMSRMLDGGTWLEEEKETAFSIQPLVPIYGNYEIINNNYVYFGKILKLMDPQRAFNYGMSRQVEDESLGMTEKIVITAEQVAGNEPRLNKLNVSNEPLLVYTHIDGQLPPSKIGSNQPNAALFTINSTMEGMINKTANAYSAQHGNAAGGQSGIAGVNQIDQGNLSNAKWMESSQIQRCGVGKVLIGAIPKVYDGNRQIRILSEDNSADIVTLNQKNFDKETNENVELNNLSHGTYDVVCEMGPAFKSAQKEAEAMFNNLASSSPEVGALTADLRVGASNTPGSKLASERLRIELFNAGRIPVSQYTDEEKQQVAKQQAEAANTPPQEDPNMVIAEAERLSAQADALSAQTKRDVAEHDAKIKDDNIQLKNREVSLENKRLDLERDKFIQSQTDKNNEVAANIDQGQQKIDLQAERQEFDKVIQEQNLFLKEQKQLAEQAQRDRDEFHKDVADWKIMLEASGANAIITPTVPEVFEQQGQTILKEQHDKENGDIN
ncbi:MAG TPA: hypothetical protein EYN54_09170 [Methylococcaceae bacterium]|nr:hypothetical protein [Methylococcaceae bacterium]